MKKHLFFSRIKKPAYVRMPAFGIDVSDSTVRVMKFGYTKHGLAPVSWGEIEMPQGAMKNGKVINGELFVGCMKKLKDIYNISFAHISLPEEQLYLFSVLIPGAKEEELEQSIELQLEDHVPIPPADIVFDYKIIAKDVGGFLVQVVAAPLSIVNDYAFVFEESGITPLSFELEADAVARASIPNGDEGTYMIVDFGNTRTGISFVTNQIVRMASTVDIGGSGQTEAISKRLGVTPAVAENMKRTKGLLRTNENQEFFSILLSGISILRDEINKHFIYWHTHKDDMGLNRPPVQKIIMVGGNANMPGLTDYLSASLKVPVVVANVWSNVFDNDVVPELSKMDSLSYATSIGLALGDISQITNVLPKEIKESIAHIKKLRWATLFSVTVSFICLIGIISIFPTLLFIKNQQNVFKVQEMQFQNKESYVLDQQLRKDIDVINKQIALLQSVPNSKIITNDIIQKVLLIKPAGISINGFSYSNQETAKSVTFSIRGKAKNREALNLFKQNLEKDSSWTGVSVPLSSFIKGSDSDFTINLQI